MYQPILITVLFLAIGSLGAKTICPERAVRGFPGFHTAPCYLYERFPTQFVTAERMCRMSGGHLASVSDGFVNAFVAQQGVEAFRIMQIQSFWIGGHDLHSQSKWEWVNDDDWRYSNWDANQPNNATETRCLGMQLKEGKWKSEDCFLRKPYVCALNPSDDRNVTVSPPLTTRQIDASTRIPTTQRITTKNPDTSPIPTQSVSKTSPIISSTQPDIESSAASSTTEKVLTTQQFVTTIKPISTTIQQTSTPIVDITTEEPIITETIPVETTLTTIKPISTTIQQTSTPVIDITTEAYSTAESTINWDPTRIHKTTENPVNPTTIQQTTSKKLTTLGVTSTSLPSTPELETTSKKLTTLEVTSTSLPSTSTDPDREPCPEGWLYDSEFTSRCYWVQPSTGWPNDQRDCESMESSLVDIHSEAENAVIKLIIFHSPITPKKQDVSIGLKERIVGKRRQWYWVYDNSAVGYSNWAAGYPRKVDRDAPLRCGIYVSGKHENGKWKDVPCDSIQARAVCSQSAYYEFSEESLKAMNVLRLRKAEHRQPSRGDRYRRI